MDIRPTVALKTSDTMNLSHTVHICDIGDIGGKTEGSLDKIGGISTQNRGA